MNELYLNLIVIAVIIIAIALLWFLGKKDIAKAIILYLVMKAEEQWGSGTGPIKFADVMGNIYSKLPLIIRILAPYSLLKKWLEDSVVYIKKELNEGISMDELLRLNKGGGQ